MEQIYTRLYSDQAVAANLPRALPSVVIAAGQQRCATLRMPSWGAISKLAVRQKSSEAQVAFTVELLKSRQPYPPDVDQPVGTPPADDVPLYRVMPQLVGVAGQAAEFFDAHGFPYRNMDGTFTENQQFLYLLIVPNGAATATTWDVSVTCRQQAD